MRTILVLGLALLAASVHAKQKNIVFIISDDLGLNDPSFRGNNQILTPNIDALTYQSVILNRYYTGPLCTPTRASLLTGQYAHRIGMQNNVVWNHQPWGLGLNNKLWPQYLREAGYRTHALGKWHLGHFEPQYLPTNRGFDTHYGYTAGAYVDYWGHFSTVPNSNFPGNNYSIGFDTRNNGVIDKSGVGIYATDLLTNKAVEIIQNADEKPFFLYLAHLAMHRATDENPLQAKPEDLEFFSHITNERRRTYAAMVKAFDDSVGRVVESLQRAGKLQDTIIVLTTDNGGPTTIELAHPNTASNWPLRGMKGLAWEGGIRVDASVYAPWLPSGVIREDKIHVTDWLQTLNSLADTGISKYDRKFDGMDLSKMIRYGQGPYRKEVETIDQVYRTISLISGKWKLVNSTFAPTRGLPDTWLGTNDQADRLADQYVDIVLNSKAGQIFQDVRNDPNPLNSAKIEKVRNNLRISCNDREITVCDILNKPCLFRIDEDPCERTNLAEDPAYSNDLQLMFEKLGNAMTKVVPPRNLPGDYASDPSNFDGNWAPWRPNSNSEPLINTGYAF